MTDNKILKNLAKYYRQIFRQRILKVGKKRTTKTITNILAEMLVLD